VRELIESFNSASLSGTRSSGLTALAIEQRRKSLQPANSGQSRSRSTLSRAHLIGSRSRDVQSQGQTLLPAHVSLRTLRTPNAQRFIAVISRRHRLPRRYGRLSMTPSQSRKGSSTHLRSLRMVRRGSTVRVRQRALQKRRTPALSRSVSPVAIGIAPRADGGDDRVLPSAARRKRPCHRPT
jgi:hypothetical protein